MIEAGAQSFPQASAAAYFMVHQKCGVSLRGDRLSNAGFARITRTSVMVNQNKTRKIKAGPLLEPALVTVPNAARFLGQGKSTIYELMGLGEIEAVKAGARTLLKVPSLKRYAASLPPAKIKPPPVRKRKLAAVADAGNAR